MTNTLWDHAYQYFAAQQAIYLKFSKIEFEQQVELFSSDEEQDNTAAPLVSTVTLTDLHAELVNNLQTLLDNITPLQTDEQHTYVLNALSFYCDEMVLTQYITQIQIAQETLDHLSRTTAQQKLTALWPKLQVIFCQCQDGGERFFANLDTLLAHPDTYRFALEIHYFCLKQGFAGRFVQQHELLEDYQAQCFKALSPFTERRLVKPNTAQHQAKSEPMLGEYNARSV
ncbi:DotU family type IV/VI secretion system protein [Paraglaciecola sp.]|uniref:DotU family type IV/VI secretion system protein n=1 Tax=Paraglaciecola sp. TaxID=1920173 RepID=UPI0030F41313